MTFTWNPRVFDDALRMAGKGLQAATIYAANCTKEILSVPAPRVRFTDQGGAKYYVAGFKISDKKRSIAAANFDLSKARVVMSDSRRTESDWRREGDYGNRGNFKFPKGMASGPPVELQTQFQTAPAIRGEPPRKLSGALRRSIAYEFLEPTRTFEGGDLPTKGRVGTNIEYAKALEYHRNNHEFLRRVFRERQKQIEQVLFDNTGAAAI